MAGTFRDSWTLTKTAFRVIREDTALLAFPALAAAAFLGILVMLGGGILTLFLFQPITGTPFYVTMIILVIVMYVLLWFNGVYFTAALVGAATMKLNGQQATVRDGLAIASAHWKKLFAWAIISGVVGLLIQAISSRVRGIGGMIIGIAAGATWSLATYFIIPVLLYEQDGAWGSLKRSATLYIHNFGRNFVSNLALGVIVALPTIGAIFLGVYGLILLFSGSMALGVLLISIAAAVFVFMLLLGGAAEGVLTAALYRFATTGKLTEDLVSPQHVQMYPGPIARQARMTSRPLPSSGPLS